MTKAEQIKINYECVEHFNEAMAQWHNRAILDDAKQLRSCTAWVYRTKDYYVLRSYNTFIACIHIPSDTCYDVLRCEYGYTSTSAQHIAKFRHDYGAGKWGCENQLTWRAA